MVSKYLHRNRKYFELYIIYVGNRLDVGRLLTGIIVKPMSNKFLRQYITQMCYH